MLYKEWAIKFYKRLFRKRLCKHQWRNNGTSSTMIHYDLFYYNHSKCNECGKKKKEMDYEKTHLSNRFTYF